ncbi:MAG: thermonuclease family protein [Verrucomicrobia bacterium]|nr:thermonuclease family protein [Verrucomicrobiota bacterium]
MLISAGFVGSVRSQSPDGPRRPLLREIRELREQFARRALDSGRVLAEQYAKALAGVETQAAESDDYETALAAQQRRQTIADNYLNRDLDSSNSIVLKPADAKITGAVSLEKSENTLAFLRTSGSSAMWDLFKLPPGNYTVNIICGVGWLDEFPAGGKSGNELEFGEVTSLTGSDTTRLGLTLEYTGGWNEYKTFTIGDIKLSRNNARLAIRSNITHGTGSLMRLKEIRLTPAPPSVNPPDKEVIAAALAELEEIRKTHQWRIKELEQPLLKAYLAKLTTLGDELIAKHDEDGAEAVMAESRRVYESFGRSTRLTRAPTGGLSTAGLQEVRGVTFVEDPTNSGDRFLVTTGGEKFSVKLMAVSCPSPNPEDQSLNKFHERYFNITTVDSATIGRQAKDFTAAFLKDRPLKLFTRWQKDRTGSVLATVLSADFGDFGGILVDNGLAAVMEPTSKNPAQLKTEAGTRDILKQREADAKAKPVPPGAWAFTGEIKTAP